MKKISFSLIPLMMLVVGCSNNVSANSIKVVCPTGAPAIAFYRHFEDNNFETNNVPSNIVSFMNASSSYDLVVIDTVSGIKAINNGAPYKIHSSITFGNFFIAATGNDDNGVMESGDNIVLFGKNQTPDLLFHYIYGNTFDDSLEYVDAVKDAAACLASGKNVATKTNVDYVFIAQPVLFAILNNKEAPTYGKSSVYANIQEEYKLKSGDKSLVQASIFVKNDSIIKCETYLKELKNDIENVVDDPTLISKNLNGYDETAVQSKYGIAPKAAQAVLSNSNGLGLGFKKAKDNKEDINNFIKIFGLEELNDQIIA